MITNQDPWVEALWICVLVWLEEGQTIERKNIFIALP